MNYSRFFLYTMYILFCCEHINNIFAQCIPDPQYTAPGLSPDSITGLDSGIVNVFYSDTVTVVIPPDTTLTSPIIITIPIDSVALTLLTGLPQGITYLCNPASCSWKGGTKGCVLISGTPASTGFHRLMGYVNYYFGGSTTPQPDSTDNYHIYIDPQTIVRDMQSVSAGKLIVFPNLVSGKMNMSFKWDNIEILKYSINDMTGREVYFNEIPSSAGENKTVLGIEMLRQGIYFLTIQGKSSSLHAKIAVTGE